ncbi:hypothetical protein HWV62_22730 [Athelia sp. TMB]|nr:hypothetical protein HWV62_22730 [Athelia sp. TMB]
MIGCFLGWTYRVHDFSTYTNSTDSGSDFMGRTISLEADLISVDPVAGAMVIDWYIIDDSTCRVYGSKASDCSNVGIYFESFLFHFFLNQFAPANLTLSYSANITFFAEEQNTAAPAPVRLEVSNSEGIAVGFKVLALSNRVNGTGPVDDSQTLQISLQVSRGVLVKTYAIIIVVAVYLTHMIGIITLVFVCSTAASVIFGIAQKSELLVVPVATLFAVTQLRGSMPGAPAGFGAIVDYVGLLPCLAIMAACAALSVGVLVFTDPTCHRRTVVDRIR